MQSSLKKSLYLGLAALSFVSVAAVSTNASAKSYAKAGAYTTLKAAATDRNVEATGTNALYTKPGTVKGAKIVASKKTMTTLATSKKSANYFRAYGQKVTNRGSVYYRVVTMDGKYRGYVYGGKTEGTFAAGVKKADTTTKATMPAQTTVYFANPGTKNVTWTAPKYTQYKASKNVTNTLPFASDKLTVTDAATKTREGSLYYYVKDATNPSVSGWIYAKALTTDASVAYNQATDVKVNFVSGGTTVATGTLKNLFANNDANNAASTTKANAVGTAVGYDAVKEADQKWANTALTGTGYTTDVTTASNVAALYAAKTGDTITLNATKGDTVTTPLYFYEGSTDISNGATALTPFKSGSTTASATTVVLPSLTAGFTGINGANYTGDTLKAFATSNNLTTLYTPTYQKDGADTYTIYTLSSAQPGTYGATGKAQLVYTAKEVAGTSPKGDGSSTSTDTGSIIGTPDQSSSSSSSSSVSSSSSSDSSSSSSSSLAAE